MADFSLPQTKADTSKKPSVTEVQESDEPHRDISGDIIEDGLRRGLKGRQFVIIALGSIIGPGCFYGLGYGIYEAGPLGLLIGFSVVGELVALQSIFLTKLTWPRCFDVDFDAECWRGCHALSCSRRVCRSK